MSFVTGLLAELEPVHPAEVRRGMQSARDVRAAAAGGEHVPDRKGWWMG